MFLAVMETGSFTGAARLRGTSSGQASKLVSRLEAELGVRLLVRTTRAVSLTEAGRAYLGRLRPLVEEFDELDLDVRTLSQAPRGRLRLTAPLTFGVLELVPILNNFALLYPDIQLDVSFSDRQVNLVDEHFDLAIRVGRLDESSLIARRLCDAPLVAIGAPAYLERRGEPATPEDLAQHECIIDSNFRDPNRWPFEASGVPLTVPVRGRFRYSTAEACLRTAEAGLGLACTPLFVADAAIRSGRVVRLLEAFETAPAGVHVLYPHRQHLATRIRMLVDFLIAHYRDASAADAPAEREVP